MLFFIGRPCISSPIVITCDEAGFFVSGRTTKNASGLCGSHVRRPADSLIRGSKHF